MVKQPLFFLLVFVACACNTAPIIYHQQKVAKATFKIQISLNGQQYDHISYQIVDINDNPFLYGLDAENFKINVYDLTQQTFAEHLDFSDEKWAISMANQFYVHSKDSIFIHDVGSSQFHLFRPLANEVISFSYLIDQGDEYEDIFDIINIMGLEEYHSNFLFRSENKSIVVPLFMFDGYDFLLDNCYKYPPLAEIQLTDEEQIPKYIGRFPSNYLGSKVPYDMFYNFTQKKENIYVNFGYSPNVLDTRADSFLTIKSNFQPDKFPIYKKGKDPEDRLVLENYHSSFHYLKTIYHPNKDYLLRICKHAQNVADADGLNILYEQAPWSIIVYDIDNNSVLREIYFEKEVYSKKWVFPWKNGFYVLKENPFDNENIEELLELDYFEL